MSDLRFAMPINDGVSRNGRLTLKVECVAAHGLRPAVYVYNADGNEVVVTRGGMRSGRWTDRQTDRQTDAPKTIETQTG